MVSFDFLNAQVQLISFQDMYKTKHNITVQQVSITNISCKNDFSINKRDDPYTVYESRFSMD